MEPKLFPIGEVAKLFHLSVSSIRHYEQIGLLTPERIDPQSGYRYYGPRQFEIFNTIRYLRALDMPLGQIRAFLQERDVDRMEDLLRRQKAAVAQKPAELHRIEQKLTARLSQLQAARTAKLGEIELLTLPACRLYQVEGKLSIQQYQDIELPISQLAKAQPEALVFLGKVGVSLSQEHLQKGQFAEYDSLFLLLEGEEGVQGPVQEVPACLSLRVRFSGSHPQAPAEYRRLLAYAQQNGLSVAGFSREITLIDYGMTNDPAQFVTEITVPVKKSDSEGTNLTKYLLFDNI